jgi:hypothetical protein
MTRPANDTTPAVREVLGDAIADRVPRDLLERVAAHACCSVRLATRVALGLPVDRAPRDRVLAAFAAFGVDVNDLPTLETGRAGASTEVVARGATGALSGTRGEP